MTDPIPAPPITPTPLPPIPVPPPAWMPSWLRIVADALGATTRAVFSAGRPKEGR